MVLTYAKYIELISALDEYCGGQLPKNKLQDEIFKRYTDKYGSFVAENSCGSKRLFLSRLQKSKRNKQENALFRNFMNQEKKKKKKNKQK